MSYYPNHPILHTSIWFTEMGSSKPIGVVLNEDETRAYIGTGFGGNEEEDIDKIRKTGAKFPIDLAKKLIGVKT